MIGYYNYTVWLIYCALASGATGIFFALRGNAFAAIICLLVAGLFDLFDGTGTICCKSFTTKEETDNIISKLEKSDTVKIIGKANLDTYAGDVTVIANTIYLTQNDSIHKKDDVVEEDTPLILGFNQNIGEKVSKIIDLSPEDRKSSFRWRSYKL